MLQNLKTIFKSNIKSLEILYVLENIKPCARILVYEDKLSNILDFLKSNDLGFSVSNFKLKKIFNENSFYSDKSVKIEKDSLEKGYFFVYISRIKELAEKAKAYEENNMHFELGMVLGYPKCCCEFFKKNFNENNADLTLETLRNSEGFEFPFYTNIAARHFDISLLSHFPCSFNCKFSIDMGIENLNLIKKHSGQLAETFENTMKNAFLYTKGNGVFLLKKFNEENNEIKFEKIIGTTKNELYNELNNIKKIKMINKNEIEINDKKISNIGMMLFTWNKP